MHSTSGGAFKIFLQCTSNHSIAPAPAFFFSPTMHSTSGDAFKIEVCSTYYSPITQSTSGGAFNIKVCSAYFFSFNALTIRWCIQNSPTMHSQSLSTSMQYILFSYKLQWTSNHSKAPAYFFSPTMHSQSGAAFKIEVCSTYSSPTTTQKHLHTLLQAVQSNPFKIVKNH